MWEPRARRSLRGGRRCGSRAVGGDHALGLEADVEQHLVAIDLDDIALDEVTVVELDDGAGHRILEGGAVHVVFGDRAGEVMTFVIEGAHGLL